MAQNNYFHSKREEQEHSEEILDQSRPETSRANSASCVISKGSLDL